MKKLLLAVMVIATSFCAFGQLNVITQFGRMVDTNIILKQVDSVLVLKLNSNGGSAALLTNFPIFNQNTTGSAQSFTGVLVGDVSGTQGATSVNKINGVTLSGLSTGILKNTTSTGVPSIAVAGDFPILNQSTTGNAATVTTNANLTGAVTSVGNVTTIATVNSTTGTFTSATITVNAAGQVTAASAGSASYSIQKYDDNTGSSSSTITLLHTAVASTYSLFKNGSLLPPAKFTLSGSTVTLTDSRSAGDILSSNYSY